MKSKSVFFLIAAVAVMGLLSGCPGEAPPETPSNNVTVKFDTDGGVPAAIDAITLTKGESMGSKCPADPTKDDYIFGGWYFGDIKYDDKEPINASITLTAYWINKSDADLITIKFTANNNNGDPVSDVQVLRDASMGNSKYPTPTYPEELKEFVGWYLYEGTANEREIKADTPIDFLASTVKSITLRAKGNAIEVTVRFDTNGGEPATIADVKVNKGDTLDTKLPADDPTITGNFVFSGWYAADDTAYETRYLASEPRIMVSVTLKARWQDIGELPPVTVTFNRNNTDATTAAGGATEADPKTVEVLEGQKIDVDSFPIPPTRSAGWGVGMVFDGWYTAETGGLVFDENTPVTEDIEVFAKWKFVAGTPQVDGETLVHVAPNITSNAGDGGVQGSWSGTISDGSANYSSGAVRYMFPVEAADYDYVTLDYVFNGTMGVILKQGTTGTDFIPTSPSGGQYPTLSASGSFKFRIFGLAASNYGIAMQRNTGTGGTIKWVKATFTKGTRYTVSFDLGESPDGTPYDGADTYNPKEVLLDAPIGTLTDPVWSGYNFIGWYLNDTNTLVTSTSTVTSAFEDATLTARWAEPIIGLDPIEVDFTVANPRVGGSSVSLVGTPTASSYTFKSNYGNGVIKFDVELPDGVSLANYDTIKFNITTTTTYKTIWVVGATNLTNFANLPGSTTNVTTHTSGDQILGSGATDMPLTFTIASSASSLTGTIQLAVVVWDNAAEYTISNFVISQKE